MRRDQLKQDLQEMDLRDQRKNSDKIVSHHGLENKSNSFDDMGETNCGQIQVFKTKSHDQQNQTSKSKEEEEKEDLRKAGFNEHDIKLQQYYQEKLQDDML